VTDALRVIPLGGVGEIGKNMLALEQGADVVVIDASESLGDAARAVAAIEALDPNIPVIVVCDGEPPRWTTGLKVTEKWEALETLPQDIRLLAEDAAAWT
jgi:hypothetical protein